jgi:hypothetical protein
MFSSTLKFTAMMLTSAIVFAGCGGQKVDTGSSVLDAPNIEGSIAEFRDMGTSLEPRDYSIVVMPDGRVAAYSGTRYVTDVGSLGHAMMHNLREITAEARLNQADTWEALVERDLGRIACHGSMGESQLILRRTGANQRDAAIAVQKSCGESWNSALISNGQLTELGYEIDDLYRLLSAFYQLSDYRH